MDKSIARSVHGIGVDVQGVRPRRGLRAEAQVELGVARARDRGDAGDGQLAARAEQGKAVGRETRRNDQIGGGSWRRSERVRADTMFRYDNHEPDGWRMLWCSECLECT